ncbi:hypothetical protein Y032_0491g2410 [Ancylostoma ceylanicum]|uniref:Uncharacterized protein n=1 Tax=Ancylostoma ceylanicum TaxID=53326 RepID=A0A016WVE9_9BILA|nr:hypothetical protein Y032_0491g2410 [Ancylostoma ceylanicum]
MVVKLSTIDCLVTVDVDGGDPSAASESTRPIKKTQMRHYGDDSMTSGAVAPRAFRGRRRFTAIDAHCIMTNLLNSC